jgi:hypothetical protein
MIKDFRIASKDLFLFLELVAQLITLIVLQNKHLMSMCVYVCKEWAIKSGPRTATFNDLLCYPYSLTRY